MGYFTIRRIYYSSSEICSMAGISARQLQIWERSYPFLRAVKNRSGRKCYKPDQLDFIKKIKELQEENLSDERITEILESGRAVSSHSVPIDPCDTIVSQVKEGLLEILQIINRAPED